MTEILQIVEPLYILCFTAKTYLFGSMNNQGVIKTSQQIWGQIQNLN